MAGRRKMAVVLVRTMRGSRRPRARVGRVAERFGEVRAAVPCSGGVA